MERSGDIADTARDRPRPAWPAHRVPVRLLRPAGRALMLRSVTEPQFGLAELRGSARRPLPIARSSSTRSWWRGRHTALPGDRLSGGLAAGDHAASAGTAVLAIILLSMWTNLLARTYAWMVLLQRTGVINKTLMALGIIDPAAAAGQQSHRRHHRHDLHHAALRHPAAAGDHPHHRPAICRPASLCGATRWQALPQRAAAARPAGHRRGALMVFVMSLGYFVTPALLGGTANMMLAELIAQFVQSLVNWGMGGAAAWCCLSSTLALYALQLRYLRRRAARRR